MLVELDLPKHKSLRSNNFNTNPTLMLQKKKKSNQIFIRNIFHDLLKTPYFSKFPMKPIRKVTFIYSCLTFIKVHITLDETEI